MKESDIMYDTGTHFVLKQNRGYTVFKPCKELNAVESDSTYALDADGLSIAIARCDYLHKRYMERLA